MRTPRGLRRNGDNRGSAKERRKRKLYVLELSGKRCVHCNRRVTFDTVEVDRINPGGSYARANVQASCGRCNRARNRIQIAAFEQYIQDWEAS